MEVVDVGSGTVGRERFNVVIVGAVVVDALVHKLGLVLVQVSSPVPVLVRVLVLVQVPAVGQVLICEGDVRTEF